MKRLTALSLMVITMICSCKDRSGSWQPKPPPKPEYKVDTNATRSVSLIALIATPEKFHRKKIRVEGFFHSEFEATELYLNTDDYLRGISKNAIWVNFGKKDLERFRQFSDHYVIIDGTFSSNMLGHDGANSGAIKDISRIDSIRVNKRKEKEQQRRGISLAHRPF